MEKRLLRISISGSVDDGKSTLLGRLLFDSKNLSNDDILRIKAKSNSEEEIDYSLFTDGLKDEIIQGITIDVAYRYFQTTKKKVIVSDTPGHEEYTRNMITGSSLADTSIILVDASRGIVEQTKRHLFLNSIMNINNVIICINKMDLIGYNLKKYEEYIYELENYISKLQFKTVFFLPVSALKGDNIFNKSLKMPWYEGPTLNYIIENLNLFSKFERIKTSFIVQDIVRYKNKRLVLGKMLSGVLRKDDKISIQPSHTNAKIKEIFYGLESLNESYFPMSVSFVLDRDIDVSRGDLISKEIHSLEEKNSIDVMFCWLNRTSLNKALTYSLIRNSEEHKCKFEEINYRYDIKSLEKIKNPKEIKMNDIFKAKLKISKGILYENYKNNKDLGSFILVDNRNNTVAFGIIH